jgi:hypothetical protein
MKITFTDNYPPHKHLVGEVNQNIQDYVARYPQIKDMDAPYYPPEMFQTAYHVKTAVQATCALMYADSNYMNKGLLRKLNTQFTNKIYTLGNESFLKQSQLMESFAKEIAYVVNYAPVTTMQTQAAEVLDLVKDHILLSRSNVHMNERSYNEAQRNLANGKAGRTGLDAFKL